MTAGQTFVNGSERLHSRSFGWNEVLTVVRKDNQSYGVERYVVRDKYGRHGFAY